MQYLNIILFITIYLWKINKVFTETLFVDILKGGGYVGLFCFVQYETHEIFICENKQSPCYGKGRDFFNETISDKFYNGSVFSCVINDCNFAKDHITLNGLNTKIYDFIIRTLSVINITNYLINGQEFTAYISNLSLIDPINVTLKFDNPLFKYTNLNINENKLNCTLQVNDEIEYNTNFVSKVVLQYGNVKCIKNFSLGYVYVRKEHTFDYEGYIKRIREENEKKYDQMKKEYEEELKRLKSLIHDEQEKPNYFILVILLPIIIVIMVLIIGILLYKTRLMPCASEDKDTNRDGTQRQEDDDTKITQNYFYAKNITDQSF